MNATKTSPAAIDRGFLIHFLEIPTEIQGSKIADELSGLHITLLGHLMGNADLDLEALIPILESIDQSPIELHFGEVAHYGAEGQHRVLTLEDPSGALKAFHMELMELATDAGFALGQPQYSGANFNPHITLAPHQNRELIEIIYGPTLRLNAFSLMLSSFGQSMEFLGSSNLFDVELGVQYREVLGEKRGILSI